MTARADKIARLEKLIAGIESSIASGESPRKIVDALVRDHGGRLQFTCGADELRIEGVAATCTAFGNGLLLGWVRAARRRIAKEAAK